MSESTAASTAATAAATPQTTSKADEEANEHKEREMAEFEAAGEGTNLIVNYIPITMSEEALRALFISYGSISRCKIVNDRFTGMSLGYGFVKFEQLEAANAAINGLNGHQIQNKRLKVSISKPPEKEKKTNLYISGLPAAYGQADLESLVNPFGKVVECRLLYDLQSRKCKGVGFARFETQKSALACINTLTGTTVDGGIMPLIVKYADTTSDKVRKAMQQGYGNLALAQNYRFPMAAAAAARGFDSFLGAPNNYFGAGNFGAGAGGLNQLGLYTGNNAAAAAAALQQQALLASNFRGAATANAANANVAAAAAALANANAVAAAAAAGANANVGGAASAANPEFAGVCLFVYHLPLEATESTLFQLFGNYGVVTSAKVMRDLLTGRSKGFGFVNVLTDGHAQAAIQGLNGFQLGNKYLKVAFKK